MKFKKLLLLILITTVATTTVFAKGKWKLAKNKDGIKVYTRAIPGKSMDEFKGEVIFNAPVEVIAEIMLDISTHKKWVKDCLKVKVLKDSGNGNMIQYYVIGAPWPVSSRDMILKAKTTIDRKNRIITITSHGLKSNLVPKTKKHVRVTNVKLKWILKSIGKDKKRSSIIYTSSQDIGGSVPTWAANMSSKDLPYYTLNSLRKMLKNRKYWDLAKKKYGIEL